MRPIGINVEYPGPSVNKTGAAELELLTNHKPEPHVKRHPPHCLRLLYTVSHACLSLVGCISSSHAIGTQRDRGLAEARVV
uniref:Fructose-bisphosphate aldolase n=1 Tax=Mesocestoides corti TaxID=53468 RepID=A0A5K3F8U0_MESCO